MLQITDSEVSAGKLVLAMDALFGLPRKKSAGTSYRDPLHGELFFCRQSPVDLFVEESAMSKKSTASTNVSALECNSRSSLIRVYSWGHSDKLQCYCMWSTCFEFPELSTCCATAACTQHDLKLTDQCVVDSRFQTNGVQN